MTTRTKAAAFLAAAIVLPFGAVAAVLVASGAAWSRWRHARRLRRGPRIRLEFGE
jgi:hypothetical protein